MGIDLMKKEAKEEFSEAVSEVGELVSSGDYTPKEAIKKVSTSHGYGRPMVENLTRTYDIGVTWNQFRNGEDLDSKVATVALAKSDEVSDELFGSVEKEAKMKNKTRQQYRKNVPDYVNELQRPDVHPVTKAASTIRKEAARNRQEGFSVKKASADLREAGRHLEAINRKIARFGREWSRHVKSARETIGGADMDFEEIHKRAAACFGPEASGYMSILAEETGNSQADLSKSAGQYFAVNQEEEPFRTIAEGVEMSKQAGEILRCKEQLARQMRKTAREMIYNMAPEERESGRAWVKRVVGVDLDKSAATGRKDIVDLIFRDNGPLQAKEAKKKDDDDGPGAGEMALGGAGGVAEGIVGSGGNLLDLAMKNTGETNIEDFEPSSKFPGDHMAELRHAKATAMLNSFLSSDPILSRRDPDEVIEKFNRIRDIRPDILEQPALARAYVRKLTETSDRMATEDVQKSIDDYLKSHRA